MLPWQAKYGKSFCFFPIWKSTRFTATTDHNTTNCNWNWFMAHGDFVEVFLLRLVCAPYSITNVCRPPGSGITEVGYVWRAQGPCCGSPRWSVYHVYSISSQNIAKKSLRQKLIPSIKTTIKNKLKYLLENDSKQ